MSQTVRYEKKDHIGIATISRPEALNALNVDVIAELEQIVTEVEKDEDLRVFIITGEGRAFVAGADIGYQQPMDLAEGRKWGQRGSACTAASRSWRSPPSLPSTVSLWAAAVSWL